MAESVSKSVLQKPPGYRDATVAPVRPPPPRKVARLPPALRQPGKPVHRRQYRPRRSLCRRFCCSFLLILFILIFFTALAAGLCYLYFQPRVPSFRLRSLNVTGFNVTTRPDGSGTFLDAAASVKIFVSNPNARIALTYGEAQARMYIADDEDDDDDDEISMESRRLPGFGQGERKATVLKLATGAESVLVDDSVGSRLRSRYRSGEVRFGVEMRTGVGATVRGRTTRRVPVKVQCRPASLRRLSRSGRTTLPKCDVYFFGWINLH